MSSAGRERHRPAAPRRRGRRDVFVHAWSDSPGLAGRPAVDRLDYRNPPQFPASGVGEACQPATERAPRCAQPRSHIRSDPPAIARSIIAMSGTARVARSTGGSRRRCRPRRRDSGPARGRARGPTQSRPSAAAPAPTADRPRASRREYVAEWPSRAEQRQRRFREHRQAVEAGGEIDDHRNSRPRAPRCFRI